LSAGDIAPADARIISARDSSSTNRLNRRIVSRGEESDPVFNTGATDSNKWNNYLSWVLRSPPVRPQRIVSDGGADSYGKSPARAVRENPRLISRGPEKIWLPDHAGHLVLVIAVFFYQRALVLNAVSLIPYLSVALAVGLTPGLLPGDSVH